MLQQPVLWRGRRGAVSSRPPAAGTSGTWPGRRAPCAGGSACSVAASFSLLFKGCSAFVQMFSPSSDLHSSRKDTKHPVRTLELSWRSGAPACRL